MNYKEAQHIALSHYRHLGYAIVFPTPTANGLGWDCTLYRTFEDMRADTDAGVDERSIVVRIDHGPVRVVRSEVAETVFSF